jgi:hypothetical protein
MSVQILQVNFTFNVSRAEYEAATGQLAHAFADVPGLRWKIWLMNEAKSEAGGIYCFEDETSKQNYLAGPLAEQVKQHPALSDFSVKSFEVMSSPTELTRGLL